MSRDKRERKFVISRSVSPPPNVGPVFWGVGERGQGVHFGVCISDEMT